jgi:hypothetical protein
VPPRPHHSLVAVADPIAHEGFGLPFEKLSRLAQYSVPHLDIDQVLGATSRRFTTNSVSSRSLQELANREHWRPGSNRKFEWNAPGPQNPRGAGDNDTELSVPLQMKTPRAEKTATLGGFEQRSAIIHCRREIGDAIGPSGLNRLQRSVPGTRCVQVDEELAKEAERQELNCHHLKENAGDEGGMVPNRQTHDMTNEHPDQQGRADSG